MIKDLESERSLVSCLVRKPELFYDIDRFHLRSDDFQDEFAQKVFNLLCYKQEKKIQYDANVIYGELAHLTKKSVDEIREYFRGYYSIPKTEYFAQCIKNSSKRRMLLHSLKDIQAVIENDHKSPEDLVELTRSKLAEIDDDYRETDVISMKQICRDVGRLMQQEKVDGIDLGFTALDKILYGIRSTAFVVIAARPGMGKTTFALQAAGRVGQRMKVLYFSFELDSTQVGVKLVGAAAKVGTNKYFRPPLNHKEYTSSGKTLVRMQQSINIDVITRKKTLEEMKREIMRLKNSDDPVGMVFVDNINNIPWPTGSKSLYEAVTQITGKLKEYALELNVPIVGLAQLNRDSVRGGERPKMHHLRDSGSIEQDADVVLLLHREDYDPDSTEDTGIIEVIVAKNRFGANGACKLFMDLETGLVDNLQYEKKASNF